MGRQVRQIGLGARKRAASDRAAEGLEERILRRMKNQ
jgi:hypothetical protein